MAMVTSKGDVNQLTRILEESLMLSIAGALQFVDMKRRVGAYENADRIWHVILEEIADVFALDSRIGFDKKRFKDRCSVFPYRELEGMDDNDEIGRASCRERV